MKAFFLLGWMKVKTISQVYIRLNEHLFKCKKYDLNFLITKVLIERIDEFPNIYIEEIAYAAQTTPASITKFCKKLGYTSFKEMRCDLDNYFIQERIYPVRYTKGFYVESILKVNFRKWWIVFCNMSILSKKISSNNLIVSNVCELRKRSN